MIRTTISPTGYFLYDGLLSRVDLADGTYLQIECTFDTKTLEYTPVCWYRMTAVDHHGPGVMAVLDTAQAKALIAEIGEWRTQ